MKFEEAEQIVNDFVNKSVENQEKKGNVFAYAYVTGQLSVYLTRALTGDTEHVKRMIIKMIKELTV